MGLPSGQWRALMERMRARLTEEHAKRNQPDRQEWVETDNGKAPRWLMEERAAMLRAVNSERAILALPPVTIADVERMDGMASGHCDYASKFGLYCAELVLKGAEEIVP